jgi:hypothetical protein
MSIEELRERNANGKMDKFLKAMSRTTAGRTNSYTKEDFYYPERDKSGNGSAIIRFLPGLESEDYPYYVERLEHSFESEKGLWYIENCPRTHGWDEECPACDYANDMKDGQDWKSIPKNVQDKIRPFFAKKQYYCNILVIKDPANPENEGKVFPFKFGKSILEIIMEMVNPVDDPLSEPKEPIDVFDLEEGANFKFIIRIKKGHTNYETSEFEKVSVCPDFNKDDQVPILTKTADDQFKSIEDLTKRFNLVMGFNRPARLSKSAEDFLKNPGKDEPEESYSVDDENGSADDENMEYFKNIADDVPF